MVQQAVAGVAVGEAAGRVLKDNPDNGASEPSIVNIELVTANKEYEYRVPTGCKKFLIHMRDGTTCRIATVRDGTKTKAPQYFTMRTGGSIWFDDLDIKDPKEAVLYFACSTANKVVEIWQWS